MSEQSFTLDINQPKSSVSANVQQNDVSSRTLHIYLTEDGIPYEPETGTEAYLEYLKPDNKKVLEKYEISGNEIVIDLTDQMMCVAGLCYGRIKLIKDKQSLHTVVFKVRVYDGLIDSSDIISSTEYNALLDIIYKAKTMIAKGEKLIEQLEEKNNTV